ncbi:MAG: UvrD-helicase domain-containing protein [Clostridia bacterium]|nr:UvrD-helicase domain-containing protein [Clostridia bacterium]
MAFTEAQNKAIDTRDKTILVSAAAGSGKTTTLTERIIRLLTNKDDPADIGRFLIVTFTNASAADLRSKITSAVSKALAADPSNRHLNRQLLKLGKAKICTMDSFYYDVVKENFQALGVGASSRIIDSNQRTVMMNEILSSLISQRYEESEDFALAIDCFLDSRGRSSAEKELISLYEKLSGYPEFLDFLRKDSEALEKEAESSFFESRSGKAIKGFCLDFLDYAVSSLSELCGLAQGGELACYYPSVLYDHDHFAQTRDAVMSGDYGEACRLFCSYAKVKRGSVKKKTEESANFTAQQDDLQKEYVKLRDKYFSQSQEACARILGRNALFCREIYGLLCEFDRRFSQRKRSLGVLDFTDNKRMTLKLFVGEDLQPTEYAKEYAKRFDAIYIDEYQDTDLVQDTIFRAISRPDNRFMVGDIKQSIYRFRGANPTVFAGYKNTFPDVDASRESDDCAIYMSENFRCDRGVVDFSNAVSDFIFSKGANSIGYVEKDALVCSKNILPEGREQKKAEFTMIRTYNAGSKEYKSDPRRYGGKGVELEAKYVAAKISELLRGEEYCEDHGVLRPIEPKDIAILARTKAAAAAFAEALEKANIPCSTLTAESYFENPEVLLAICLLQVIDNPQKDVYLAGLLRSPLYGFNLDELARIRKRGTKGLSLYDNLCEAAERETGECAEKIKYFCQKLELYREQARILPVDKLLRYLYFDTDMLSFAAPAQEGEDNYTVRERRANLLVLYEYARNFESGSFKGLYSFICFIRDTIEAKQTVEPAGRSGDSNIVSIMTVHSSKGLEFPVCFITSCGRNMNRADSGAVAFSRDIGVSASFRDGTGLAVLRNPVIEAIKQRNSLEDSEEEMRVLYVAMTRARERLFLVGSYTGETRFRNISELSRNPHSYSVMTAPNWDTWISAALGGKEDLCDIRELEPYEVQEPVALEREARENVTADPERIEDYKRLFLERFDFKYDDRFTGIPAKMSVSRLYPGVLDTAERESDDREIEIPEIKNAPAFLLEDSQRASGAERGTATHLFMQFCDFENARSAGARAEAKRLAQKGFIFKDSIELMNFGQLEGFFKSEFFSSLSKAKRVWREQRFNLLLPASKFTENPAMAESLGDTRLAVQGVIDLVFEDEKGDLILADYKTDYLTAEEKENPSLALKKLGERHREQLSYYREAVKQIFGREPSRVCIYSLPLGMALDIETDKI